MTKQQYGQSTKRQKMQKASILLVCLTLSISLVGFISPVKANPDTLTLRPNSDGTYSQLLEFVSGNVFSSQFESHSFSQEGFDGSSGDTSLISIQSSVVYHGTYAAKWTNVPSGTGPCRYYHTFASSYHYCYVQVMVRFNTLPDSSGDLAVFLTIGNSGGSWFPAKVIWNDTAPNVRWAINKNPPVLEAATGPVTGQWYRVELRCSESSGTYGNLQMYVDGTLLIDYVESIGAPQDMVRIGTGDGAYGVEGFSLTMEEDDLIVSTYYIGVQTHSGLTNDQSDLTGLQAYQNTTIKETLNLADTSQTGTISDVTVYCRAKTDGSTADKFVFGYIKDSSYSESSEIDLTTSDAEYSVSLGSSWTWTEINSIQVGWRPSTLASGKTEQFPDIWIVVTYSTNANPSIGEFQATNIFYAGKYGWLNATCQDLDGQTDISKVFVAFQIGSESFKLSYISSFSLPTNPNNRITLDVSTSVRVSVNSTSYKYAFYLRIDYNATLDSTVDIVSGTGVQDVASATGNVTQNGLFAYENRVKVSSVSVNDERVNPSQSLSFTVVAQYYGTSTGITNLDSYITARIELSGSLKGSSSSFNGGGQATIIFNAESNVDSHSYNAYATPVAQNTANATQEVVVDKIKVSSYSVLDSRVNINDNVNIDVALVYAHDSAQVTMGMITINGYSASHLGSGVYRITRTSASVDSVTYDTVAGSETTYGLNTVDQNGKSAMVVWDECNVYWWSTNDTRLDWNNSSKIMVKIASGYDQKILNGTEGSTCLINGTSATWNNTGSYWYIEKDYGSSIKYLFSVSSINDAVYDITSFTHNVTRPTVNWDRVLVVFFVSKTNPSNNELVTFTVNPTYESDGASVGSYTYDIDRNGILWLNDYSSGTFTDIGSNVTRTYDFVNTEVEDLSNNIKVWVDPSDLTVTWYSPPVSGGYGAGGFLAAMLIMLLIALPLIAVIVISTGRRR